MKIQHMRKLLYLFFFFLFTSSLMAQHCPYCGSYVIVVVLKNNKGKIITDSTYKITLQEINNPLADSCQNAEGIQTFHFASIEKNWILAHNGFWENSARKLIQETGFYNKNGYYSVILNQASNQCMIKQANNDYKYIPRLYQVEISHNEKVIKSIEINQEQIFSLCTAQGNWKRIKAIVIELEK